MAAWKGLTNSCEKKRSKKQRRKNQINKIRNENGEITRDNTEIQSIIRDNYQQLSPDNHFAF